MGGIVFLMLVRMWSWGFELHLYDHDVFVSCINVFVVVYWLFVFFCDYRRRVWAIMVFSFFVGCLNIGVLL